VYLPSAEERMASMDGLLLDGSAKRISETRLDRSFVF